jgi:ribosomal protein L30/L7E
MTRSERSSKLLKMLGLRKRVKSVTYAGTLIRSYKSVITLITEVKLLDDRLLTNTLKLLQRCVKPRKQLKPPGFKLSGI